MKNKKKILTILLIILSFSLILTGCSNSTDRKEKKSGDNTSEIRMAWWGSQSRNDYTVALLKKFESNNKNIQITAEFSGWDGYWDKMATEFSGGSGPDVFQNSTSYIRQYAQNNSLMDLTNAGINFDTLDKNSVDTGKIDGKIYGIPTGVNAMSLYYDPEIIKQSGITFDPDSNITWDQFANLAKQVQQKLPDVYGTQSAIEDLYSFQLYARDHGEDIYNKDATELGFSEETLASWFDYWLKLQEDKVAPPADITSALGSDIEQYPIVKKKAAFSFIWSSMYTSVTAVANRPLEMTFLPQDGNYKPYYLHPSMYWSIAKDTKDPKASARLVNYLLNSEEASQMIKNDRGVPINAKFRDELAQSGDQGTKKEIAFINKVIEVSGAAPVIPSSAEGNLTELLKNTAQKVEFKKVAPKDAANEFFQKTKDILNKS